MVSCKTRRGFTIVELLVVVVVLAILLLVARVSYQGVTRRAHNAQTLAAVKQYYDALNNYRLQNKAYPMPAVAYDPNDYFFRACLGTKYLDEPGITDATAGDKDCWVLKDEPNGTHPQSWFDDALKDDKLPEPYPSRSTGNYGTNTSFVGAAVYFRGWGGAYNGTDPFTVNGKRHDWYLYYLLEGNQKCGVGDVLNYEPGYQYPHFITGGSLDYTERINDATLCMIMLPAP